LILHKCTKPPPSDIRMCYVHVHRMCYVHVSSSSSTGPFSQTFSAGLIVVGVGVVVVVGVVVGVVAVILVVVFCVVIGDEAASEGVSDERVTGVTGVTAALRTLPLGPLCGFCLYSCGLYCVCC